MNSSLLQGIFLVCTVLFSIPTLRVIISLVRLLMALFSGAVKWPGPMIHDPNPNITLGRRRAGLKPDYLFSTFVESALALLGTFAFFFLSFLSGTSLFAGQIHIRYPGLMIFLSFLAFLAGIINSNKSLYHLKQVNILLSDLRPGVEPRHIDGSSVEAEYAIEHPLLGRPMLTPEFLKALQLFWDGTTYFQSGNQQKASIFYQEALETDPGFHERARQALAEMAKNCSSKEAGPIYYWLGAHSEYLLDRMQAKAWYEKAIVAFNQIGYPKRESRARCNLGNVKMQTMDSSAMDEFEKAIALNPNNGTAHINIGTIYYRISERGDPRFERALDAYADAIIADPFRFGPVVISRLREIGYTWKEDLEDITQRVEAKRRALALKNS